MDKRAAEKLLVGAILDRIKALPPQPLTLMEVCGTHTMSIARYGLRSLLPPWIKLISGPGCPVCVTDAQSVGAALAIAKLPGVILTSFGDMLRVPAGRESLLTLKEAGADVRLTLSPLEALELAKQEPGRQVVFLAVGFETTAPLTASTLQLAAERGVENFSVLSLHKTMPQALIALLEQSRNVDGLLCPGHVAAIIGAEGFCFLPERLGLGGAVAGFTPADILLAVERLILMRREGRCELVNCYQRAVRREGNPVARRVMAEVFTPVDAMWRGLGLIPGSGLGLRPEYGQFDAARRFATAISQAPPHGDDPACCCGQVLRGRMEPADCPLFGRDCLPEHPAGACMVSSEGACAAAWRYGQYESEDEK